MSLTTITIEGKEYHAEEDGACNIVPLRDEDGELIPSYVCLCSAHSAFECVCGAWERECPDLFKDPQDDI